MQYPFLLVTILIGSVFIASIFASGAGVEQEFAYGPPPNLKEREEQMKVLLYGAIIERAVPTCDSIIPGYKTRFDSAYKSWQERTYSEAKITDAVLASAKSRPEFTKTVDQEFGKAFNGKSDTEKRKSCEKILSQISKPKQQN